MTKTGKSDERRVCLNIICDVLENGRFLHLALKEELDDPSLSAEERAFITRLSRGCVESCAVLDEKIDRVSSVKCRKMRPVIRNILRMSAYQLYFMDVPAHAVCNEAVRLAERSGMGQLKAFVNAVSRKLAAGAEEERLQENKSHAQALLPAWLEEKLRLWYGDVTAEKYAESLQTSDRRLRIRLLTAFSREEDILKMLEEDGAELTPSPYARQNYELKVKGGIRNLRAYQKGLFIVQDASSSLAADCLSPLPGSLVIDVCSAPGGKAIALADEMRDTGRLISRDVSERKCRLITENVNRTRFTCIETVCRDAGLPDPEFAGKADFVLADVPCSGLGVLKNKPDILLHLKEESLEELEKLQLTIAGRAADLLKPGGIMVYSTCTVNPGENRENVKRLLERGDLELQDLTPFIREVPEGADPQSGMLQLIPGVNRCDGFFLARLQKKR